VTGYVCAPIVATAESIVMISLVSLLPIVQFTMCTPSEHTVLPLRTGWCAYAGAASANRVAPASPATSATRPVRLRAMAKIRLTTSPKHYPATNTYGPRSVTKARAENGDPRGVPIGVQSAAGAVRERLEA